jgi:hypothetical protein
MTRSEWNTPEGKDQTQLWGNEAGAGDAINRIPGGVAETGFAVCTSEISAAEGNYLSSDDRFYVRPHNGRITEIIFRGGDTGQSHSDRILRVCHHLSSCLRFPNGLE